MIDVELNQNLTSDRLDSKERPAFQVRMCERELQVLLRRYERPILMPVPPRGLYPQVPVSRISVPLIRGKCFIRITRSLMASQPASSLSRQYHVTSGASTS